MGCIGMVKGRASATAFDNACGMHIYFNQPISYRATVTPSKDAREDTFRDKNTGLRKQHAAWRWCIGNIFGGKYKII